MSHLLQHRMFVISTDGNVVFVRIIKQTMRGFNQILADSNAWSEIVFPIHSRNNIIHIDVYKLKIKITVIEECNIVKYFVRPIFPYLVEYTHEFTIFQFGFAHHKKSISSASYIEKNLNIHNIFSLSGKRSLARINGNWVISGESVSSILLQLVIDQVSGILH